MMEARYPAGRSASTIIRVSGAGAEDPSAPGSVVKLRAEAVDWREIDGEVVALDRKNSSYLSINRSGAVMWPVLEQGTTVDQLVAVLVERFDVEPTQARSDVEAFLHSLDARDLLER